MAFKALTDTGRPALFYIGSETLTPASSPSPLPAGERLRPRGGYRRLKQPVSSTGQTEASLVQAGMIIKINEFLMHYVSILICLWITAIMTGGCSSFGKSQQPDLFKEYRKKLEMQKAALAKEEEKQIVAPELGAEEHERLGNLYLRQGNPDLAFLEYDKALRRDPSRTHIHYKLGRLFLEREIPEEAAREFQEILKVAPDDALAHEGMGRVYFKQADFAEAERSFKRAIDLKNDLWQSHNFLGIIYDRQGTFDLAITHYRSAIALKPNSSMLYNNLGISLLLKREYEEAVGAFKEALSLENSNRKIHNNLALALSKLKSVEEAIEARKGREEASAHDIPIDTQIQGGKSEEEIW
jgi:Flp pilus assembly protein TadD